MKTVNLLNAEYLTRKHLDGFKKYKYNAIDSSPVSEYILNPVWSYVIELFPRWIAPNVMTFAGFCFIAFNFLLFSYYDYEFYASNDDRPDVPPIPRWVWIAAAFNLFTGYALDCLDGKQARRTGTSGPLGELFDHGLDSWTTFFMTVCMFSIFGRSDEYTSYRMYFILWNVLMSFYMCHWEKYNTGALFLPWSYDVTMLAMVFAFLFTAAYGHQAWKSKLFGDVTAEYLFEIVSYSCAMLHNIPVCSWNVYKSYRDKTGKMLSFYESFRPLIPMVLFITMCTVWMLSSPVDVIGTDFRAAFLVIGTIFSNISARLIVSQMSSTRCEIFNWLLVPFFIVVVTYFQFPTTDGSSVFHVFLLRALVLFLICAHVHYGVCLVRQMCRHFNIQCFRISKNQKRR